MTTDESWFFQYEPGSKIANMEWLQQDENRGQVVALEQSVKKVMFIPFFDLQGIVHKEYFHNQAISKEVFAPVLRRAHESIRKNRSADVWENHDQYLLHMDNALAHRACLIRDLLQDELHWHRLTHPPYSPDLSPGDFFLFPRLKKYIRGIKFPNTEALVVTIECQLQQITAQEWKNCFLDWIRQCKHCIQFDGQYFEEMKFDP